jgi:hypothetical protein
MTQVLKLGPLSLYQNASSANVTSMVLSPAGNRPRYNLPMLLRSYCAHMQDVVIGLDKSRAGLVY